MFRLFVTTSFLFVSANAVAGENAFNADMENSTISTAISEFEEVCFPFIAHETELTPEQDREVFHSLMVEAGYEFGDEKVWKGYKNLGLDYSPTRCPAGSFPPATPRVEGKYTIFPASNRVDANGNIMGVHSKYSKYIVFNGISNQVVSSTNTIIGPTCELSGPIFSPSRSTRYRKQRYEKRNKPISAYLTWQEVQDVTSTVSHALRNTFETSYGEVRVRTSFPPASSCTIHAKDKILTADIIESAIIAHDNDWKRQDVKRARTKEIVSDAHSWSHCTRQDEENYVYKASLVRDSFSLSVEVLQDDDQAFEYGCEASAAD